MNIKLATQHHAKAGTALAAGDAQTAMHHIGHIMQALKAGPSAPATALAAPGGPAGIPGVPQAPQAHKKLGVPEGEKIPAKKLAGAEKSSSPTERKEANLARTLKSFNHSKK